MEDIESGLDALVRVVSDLGITSIAIPPLGCGNGGLDWRDVRPRIERAFSALSDVRVLVFAPEGAPSADEMRVATKKPRVTATRAALLGLLEAYAMPGYRVGMLEIQKLAYFLQQAGEPLKLTFVRGQFGPYAETLHHVLQRLEGHYIRGYGDRSRDVSITLLDGAEAAANTTLAEHDDTRQRLQRVSELIAGFETPYGLELLATVHKIAEENPAARKDPVAATLGVQEWSDRKRERFSPNHVRVAWNRLRSLGWF
jgi:O-acetyl-ADP-ribose deacetylase (regulator of RNase III)